MGSACHSLFLAICNLNHLLASNENLSLGGVVLLIAFRGYATSASERGARATTSSAQDAAKGGKRQATNTA